MANEKKPSIYSDRGSIGTVDELDEYGVWVKSEPQELSADSMESEKSGDLPLVVSEEDIPLEEPAFDDIGFPDNTDESQDDLTGDNFSSDGIVSEDLDIPADELQDELQMEETDDLQAGFVSEDLDIPTDETALADDDLASDDLSLPEDDLVSDDFAADDLQMEEIDDLQAGLASEDLNISADEAALADDDLASEELSLPEDDLISDDFSADELQMEETDDLQADLTSEDLDITADEAALADDEFASDDLSASDDSLISDDFAADEISVTEDDPVSDSLASDETAELEDNIVLDDITEDEIAAIEDDFGIVDNAQELADDLDILEDETIDITPESEASFDVPTVKSIENNIVSSQNTFEAAQTENKNDLSTQLLLKIANELSSIRTELTDLKKEFAIVRTSVPAAEVKTKENEADHSGFFSEEEDETIALTGDELDNILNTADFTEESGGNETVENEFQTEDVSFEEPAGETAEEITEEPADEDLSIELEDIDIELSDEEPSAVEETDEELLVEAFEETLEETLSEDGADDDTILDEPAIMDLDGFEEEKDDELEKLREEGAEPVTPAPENSSYLEEDGTDLEFDADSIDLSNAVIDEPVLSTDDIDVTEPSLDDIDTGIDIDDSLEDLSIDIEEDLQTMETEDAAAIEDLPAVEELELEDDLAEVPADEPAEELSDDTADDLVLEELEEEPEEVSLEELPEELPEEIPMDLDISEDDFSVKDDLPEEETETEDEVPLDIEVSDDEFPEDELSSDIFEDDDEVTLQENEIAEVSADEPSDMNEDDIFEQVIPEGFEAELEQTSKSLDDDLSDITIEDEQAQEIQEEPAVVPPPPPPPPLPPKPAIKAESAIAAAPPAVESMAALPPEAAKSPGPAQPAGGTQSGKNNIEIPSALKSELRNILTYMDQLLESLPEEKIEEFAKSEYFDSYKKLFKELGLV